MKTKQKLKTKIKYQKESFIQVTYNRTCYKPCAKYTHLFNSYFVPFGFQVETNWKLSFLMYVKHFCPLLDRILYFLIKKRALMDTYSNNDVSQCLWYSRCLNLFFNHVTLKNHLNYRFLRFANTISFFGSSQIPSFKYCKHVNNHRGWAFREITHTPKCYYHNATRLINYNV